MKVNLMRTLRIAILPLVLWFIFMCCHIECYCPIWPSIDTKYTSGFSQQTFEALPIGATTNEVQALLGNPGFGISPRPDGNEIWWYSGDGKCTFGDFAWIAFYIVISNGIAIEKQRRVFYD